MFDFLQVDYSPPLYSVVLKLYSSVFGTDIIACRSFTLILICSQFFFAFFPIRRIFGKACSYAAAILFLTSSYNFYLGVAIRPTVLAYALTTGMFVYAVSAYTEEKLSELVKFSVFSILCMYTHNVSLIAAFCIYATTIILALIKKNMVVFKRFLISGITVAILFIPWLIVLLTQTKNVSDHFWSNKGTWPYALYLVFLGNTGNLKDILLSLPVLFFIFLLPLINIIVFIRKDRIKEARSLLDLIEIKDIKNGWQNPGKVFYLLLIVFMSVTGFYLVTELFLPIFTRRYFYTLSGAGIVVLASIATLCKNKKFPTAVISILCVFSFAVNTVSEMQIIRMSDRDRMVADITAMTDGKIQFIDFYEEALGVSSYYFPDAKHYVTDEIFTVLPNFDVFGDNTTYLHNGDDVWDYTDEVYIFSAFDFELSQLDPYEFYEYYFNTPENITIEEIDEYILPYPNEIGYGIFDVTLYRITKN
ncbi:MAG: glycosyltransferase family 39 protein [Saccharofermentans sp.]|nr:glycosyltransferase family 39 protein [Saccharofermentans sp.]